MKNNKGFVISTMLYSIFGIMLLIVFYILYILSNNRMILVTSIKEIKNDLETESKEKIYIHFVISDYIKASYNEENLKNIVDNISKETNYIVDYKIENTSIEEKSTTLSVENKTLFKYGKIAEGGVYSNDTANCANYHGIFGDYVLVSRECTGTTSQGYYNGSGYAYLINVYSGAKIDLFKNLNYGTRTDERQVYMAIDTTNHYIYAKFISATVVGSASSSKSLFIYYARIPYDEETLEIDEQNIEYGYNSDNDNYEGNKCSTSSKFQELENSYYNLSGVSEISSVCFKVKCTAQRCREDNTPGLIYLHNNPFDYPSNYKTIYNGSNYEDKSPTYLKDTTFFDEETHKRGILLRSVKDDPSTSSTREIAMLWYKGGITYSVEKIPVNPSPDDSKKYKKQYFIFIKEDNEANYDEYKDYHLSIDGSLDNIKDYTTFTFTDETTKEKLQNGNTFGENITYKDCFSNNCSNNVDATLDSIKEDIVLNP